MWRRTARLVWWRQNIVGLDNIETVRTLVSSGECRDSAYNQPRRTGEWPTIWHPSGYGCPLLSPNTPSQNWSLPHSWLHHTKP